MSTRSRMNAPIGRVKITPSEGRSRRRSRSGRWRAADPPIEPELTEVEEAIAESSHPPFYPFPLRSDAECDD